MKQYLEFFLALLLVSAIFIISLTFTFSRKAEAIIPVTDVINIGVNSSQLSEFIIEVGLFIQDKIVVAIVKALAKQIMDEIVNEIIAWINGEGKPRFLSDFSSVFEDAADQAAGKVLVEITSLNLCADFAFQVNFLLPKVKTFGEKVECTFSDATGNINDFMNSFENGGWTSYMRLSNAENNVYGLSLLVLDEQNAKALKAEKEKEKDAEAGRGFLSDKKCVKLKDLKTGEITDYSRNLKNAPSTDDFDAESGLECVKSQIVTPGDLVGNLLNKGIESQTFGTLLAADDASDYIAAITNAAVNRVVKEGFMFLVNSVSDGDKTLSGGSSLSHIVPFIEDEINNNLKENSKLKIIYDNAINLAQSNVNVLTGMQSCYYSACYNPLANDCTTKKNVCLSDFQTSDFQTCDNNYNSCVIDAGNTCKNNPTYLATGTKLTSQQNELTTLGAARNQLNKNASDLNALLTQLSGLSAFAEGSDDYNNAVKSVYDKIQKLPDQSDYLTDSRDLLNQTESLTANNSSYTSELNTCQASLVPLL